MYWQYSLYKQVAELEKRQSGSEQVAALQAELQQLTERLERVQLEKQDKQEVCRNLVNIPGKRSF